MPTGRLERGHLASVTDDLDVALESLDEAAARLASSDLSPMPRPSTRPLAEKGVVPDVVTDLTAAHDAVFGYCPVEYSLEQWRSVALGGPGWGCGQGPALHGPPGARRCSKLKAAGAVVFEDGNNLRVQAEAAGVRDAFTIDGFAERYLRPLFCRGIGPFRWVALSGEPSDLAELDRLVVEMSFRPEVESWISLARAQRHNARPASS